MHVISGPVPLGESVPYPDVPLLGLRFSTNLVRSITGEATFLWPDKVRKALRQHIPSLLSLEIDPSVFDVSLRMKAEALENVVELRANAGFAQPIDLIADVHLVALHLEVQCMEEVLGQPCSLWPKANDHGARHALPSLPSAGALSALLSVPSSAGALLTNTTHLLLEVRANLLVGESAALLLRCLAAATAFAVAVHESACCILCCNNREILDCTAAPQSIHELACTFELTLA